MKLRNNTFHRFGMFGRNEQKIVPKNIHYGTDNDPFHDADEGFDGLGSWDNLAAIFSL